MNMPRALIAAGLSMTLAACDAPTPAGLASAESPTVALSGSSGGPDSAHGGGFLDFGGGLLVQFAFSANQNGPGMDAQGQMRFSVELGGELIDFHGQTTCLAVDGAEGRAWIGGVVTQNNSTHSGFTTDVHDVGDDIWFRVLDLGEGSGAIPDRSTFVGFEGGGGIITSEEYCAAQIWPDGNARTVPQASGNIQVED
ncbi:MAG: hypothetical protein OEU54_11925 [Gemmatimonadota bacterium]|nr:hypothetical protein [Gemmatimonadota bacterium]